MRRWLIAAVPLFLVSSFTLAAPGDLASPGDRELIRDRQQRLLEEQRQRLQDLQQLPGREAPSAPAVPVEEPRCFEIRRIRLQGATLIGERRQRELLAPYEGRCLGASQLNELLKTITDHYLAHGYVTSRAYLPQQDLSDGELEVLVVEGRLEGLDSSEGGPSAREIAMAFPARAGERLNLRELEQMVDQLGRLPSRQAQIELLPGQQVGGSRVQVKGQAGKPWRVSLSRHNDGDQTTGEQQWGAGLDWDSPLGLADQLSLRGGGDTVSDHWRHSANQARYDKYTLTLSYLQPFQLWNESFSFDSLAYGQKSEDILYSPQRVSLGGLSSVRGFKEQSLSGDSGGYWRNQWRWRRPVAWAPLQPWLQEYAVAFAYDVGVIHGGRYNPQAHGRLSGNAFELSARGPHLAATVTLARSLERPDIVERREHPIYFSVDLFF